MNPERTTTYRLMAENEAGISVAEARLVVEGTEEVEMQPPPSLQGVTLRVEYAVSYSDTTAPDLDVRLSGRWSSGSGTIGQSNFTMTLRRQLPAAGGVPFPPHEENVSVAIPNLRSGIWEVTAMSNLGGGAGGITCSRAQAPGVARISTLAGAQPCQ